jgi:membrane-associated phospholipid phosphatase
MIRTMLAAVAASLMLLLHPASADAASIATEWLDEVLSDAKEVAWEPTVGARFLAIVHTAMYDAWTAYDPVAVGRVTGRVLKGQGGLDNEANKREAISHAAFTVLRTLAPQRRHALVERMRMLGYDPNADTPAARVGRRAALAVIAVCRDDGANETGNFADTTGYAPRKSGEASAWQPIEELGRPQLPTSPHWSRVSPFALASADQFRPRPPPAPESAEWSDQIRALISASEKLTDAQKAAAEYWGIAGMAPPPQLFELTKFVSNANDLRLDDDIKLLFIVSNAILDASIATWESKYAYDYLRPITAIRALGDTPIKAWRPRSMPAAFAHAAPLTRGDETSAPVAAGTGELRAADWQPYLPTPPFPAYVSGHSAFTAAWARVMELATGHQELNFRKTMSHLYVEQHELTKPVTLDYPTFASAAEASGASRIWAGIHWPIDDESGQELGRKVGELAWQRGQQFILGSASPAAAIFLALRPPYWFYESLAPDHPVQFRSTEDSLTIDVAAGGAGAWRSIVVDAVPAGTHEMTLVVAATGDGPIHLAAVVEASNGRALLGRSEAILPPNGSPNTITVRWTSDGSSAFRVSVETRVDDGRGKMVVSSIAERRSWHTLSGLLRYYEMSTAGQRSSAMSGARSPPP